MRCIQARPTGVQRSESPHARSDQRTVGKTFTFGLERVRELREHTESRAKEDLAASLHQRFKGAAMLAAASGALGEAASAGRPEQGELRAAGDLLAHERWLQALRRDEEAKALSLDR